MSNTLSPEAIHSTNDCANGGRFAAGNAGGPGNPFARQTAALRTYLIAHVTERDIQDILDILLLNAKGGHLPTIKFLFSYVIGKPKPVVEPDLLDLQEMQMLQQSALPPEALQTLCDQLPLDLQVQLTHGSQTDNATAAVRSALDNNPAPAAAPPPSAPSTNRENGAPPVAERPERPSTNGENQKRPKRAGFDWLRAFRRPAEGRPRD